MTTIAFPSGTCLPDPDGRRVRNVRCEQGRLFSIDRTSSGRDEPAEYLLTPGLIDVHTHGIEHSAYGAGPGALETASRALPRYGVTCAYPTLVPHMDRGDVFDAIGGLARALEDMPGAVFPGLHLEGPFVALSGAGCSTLSGDRRVLDDLLDAGGDKVRIMSVAPEVPGILPLIERLVERGVVPFVTHTRATVEETRAAIDAGARHATHFYDVFPVPEASERGVRPAGAVETFLADARCTVDFVADGVHVHPVAIGAALAAKGPAGVLLVTDSNIGAGLPAGLYETPWGYPVRTGPEGGARVHDPGSPKHNGLAGSCLTMDEGVRNLAAWLPLSLGQAFAMGSANPARLMGINKGLIDTGRDADLVLWARRGRGWKPARVWVAGRPVWEESPS